MINEQTLRARELRQRQTKAESLLWNVLRAKRICDKKFRRQHPIGPYFADFVCTELMLIIEIDGGYHDYKQQEDANRQRYLEDQGWRVLRYTTEDVVSDVEAISIAIAKEMGFELQSKSRVKVQSGMRSPRVNRQQKPK